MSGAPVFAGFGPRALDFLKALAFHQDKSWFEENRALYESDVRAPFEALLLAVTARLAEHDLPIRGDARSIFRLHRDVRFAKDKRPYKTNAGAVLTRDGTKRSPGLVYVHVDPEGCFLAAGFHGPEPAGLARIRRRIVKRASEYREIAATLAGAGLPIGGEPLSRLPKGFEEAAEPDIAAAVRLKSLVIREPLPAAAIRRPDLADRVTALALRAEPLLRFGWSALADPD